MKIKLALISLLVFVFCESVFSQVTIDTSGGGGAVTTTSSPINQAIGGSNNAQGGVGGSGGLGESGGLGGTSSATGGLGGQGGNSSAATGSSSSSGNTSGNASVSSNYVAPKIPVSTAYAPGNFPTAPCMGATSLGTSGVMFGFSAGSSWEATECMRLEMARSFEQAGHTQDAQAVRCSSKYAVDAPSCIKLREEKGGANRREKPLVAPLEISEQPKQPQATQFIEGAYFESIDPETGFKTIIDIRDSYRHVAMP